jgi:hypothetical protein
MTLLLPLPFAKQSALTEACNMEIETLENAFGMNWGHLSIDMTDMGQ